MTPISLAHLTVIHASPPELIRIAGNCGYDLVGLRLLEVVGGDAWPLATSPELMRETKAALRDHGIGVLDVELAKLQPDTRVSDFIPFLGAAAEVGASHVLCQAHDNSWSRLVENFAQLCDLAAAHDLTVDVEFLTWTEMRDLAGVVRLLDEAAKANAGVMIDTLHFWRSNCDPADIDALDPGRIHFLQICDAPARAPDTAEGLIFAAREDRLNPGEGGLDLVGILKRLPAETPVAVEIPSTRLAATLTDEERARRALHATRRVIAAADSARRG